eukprot:GHVN01046288.1.p1 GENE.GHVN01046288.1~~GHVN01046288.1.p1  ORF type:complete len:632 (+),score=59.98 GHVN01046288.1:3094-4989(+)
MQSSLISSAEIQRLLRPPFLSASSLPSMSFILRSLFVSSICFVHKLSGRPMSAMDLNAFVEEYRKGSVTGSMPSFQDLFENAIRLSATKGTPHLENCLPAIMEMLFGDRNSIAASCQTSNGGKMLMSLSSSQSLFFGLLLRFSSKNSTLGFWNRKEKNISPLEFFLEYLVKACQGIASSDNMGEHFLNGRRGQQRQNKDNTLSLIYMPLFEDIFSFFIPTGQSAVSIITQRISDGNPQTCLKTSISLTEAFLQMIAKNWLGESPSGKMAEINLLFVSQISKFFQEMHACVTRTNIIGLEIGRLLEENIPRPLFSFLVGTFSRKTISCGESRILIRIWLLFTFPFREQKDYRLFALDYFSFFHTLLYAFIEREILFLREILSRRDSKKGFLLLQDTLAEISEVLDSFQPLKSTIKENACLLTGCFDNYKKKKDGHLIEEASARLRRGIKRIEGSSQEKNQMVQKEIEKTLLALLMATKNKVEASMFERNSPGILLPITETERKVRLFFDIDEEKAIELSSALVSNVSLKKNTNHLKHVFQSNKNDFVERENSKKASSSVKNKILLLSVQTTEKTLQTLFLLFCNQIEKKTSVRIPALIKEYRFDLGFFASPSNLIFFFLGLFLLILLISLLR